VISDDEGEGKSMADPATGTVSRVIALLACLAAGEHDGTLTSIAQRVNLPPSTAHRLLHLLTELGIVRYDDKQRRYAIGSELYRIAGLVSRKMRITELALPALEQIVAECNETAVLSVYVPEEETMMFTELVDSRQPLRYSIPLFVHFPLEWGASGRVLLAYLPSEVRDRVVARAVAAPGTGQPLDPAELDYDLSRVREQGYAVSRGQKFAGAVGLAAPVFNARHHIVAGLCVTVPDVRYRPESEHKVVWLLRRHARELSRALGDTEPYPGRESA
jgi:DNA-binding IclR family transcriptional regulator